MIFQSLAEYIDKFTGIPKDFELEKNSENAAVQVINTAILNPCRIILRNLLKLEFESTPATKFGPYILYPDYVVSSEGRNILVLEFKRPGLELFIKRDPTSSDPTDDYLDGEDAKLNSIIKQVSVYLIAEDLEECLLTDFKVTIYLRPNLIDGSMRVLREKYPVHERKATDDQSSTAANDEPSEPTEGETSEGETSEGETSEPAGDSSSTDKMLEKYVEVPYEYQIIRNTDCGITLQAVVASLIHEKCFKVKKEKKEMRQRKKQRVSKSLLPEDPTTQLPLPEPTNQIPRLLNQILTMSKSDQETARTDDANIHLEEIIDLAGESRFKEVEKSRFYSIVKVDMNSTEKVKPICVNPECLSMVYLFPYEKYSSCFENKGVSKSVPQTAIMKVYGFTHIENYTKSHFKELRDMQLIRDINDSSMDRYAAELMLNEAACYERIKKSQRWIRVPELYDYGVMITMVNGYPVQSGYYLLMEYLDVSEDDKKLKKLERVYQLARRKGDTNIPRKILEDVYGENIQEGFDEYIKQRLEEFLMT